MKTPITWKVKKYLIVVDPGSHWEAIRQTIENINKPICAILLTHAHYDHIMSLDLVRETFGNSPVYIAESEASWLYTPVDNLSGLPRHDDMADVVAKPAEHTFAFHEEYQLEEFRFTVLPTPGHSIGGVSIVFPDAHLVLTGDALSEKQSDGPTFRLVAWSNSFIVSRPNSSLYQTMMSIQGMVQLLLLPTKRLSIPFSSKQKTKEFFSLVFVYCYSILHSLTLESSLVLNFIEY